MAIESFCKWCGKPIVVTSSKVKNQLYCDGICRRKAHEEKAKERKKRKREEEKHIATMESANRLETCMNEAERLGLTYGEYMARRYAGG